jgi:hypothetical protein
MANRRLVISQTRLSADPAGYRFPWEASVKGPPPPHPGREIALPVGVVRWNCPTPSISLVVKLTYSYGPHAEVAEDGAIWAEPVDPQPPLSGTIWDGDPSLGQLAHPTDFVPFKARADILIKGHAYAHEEVRPEATRTVIQAGFSVDNASRTFAAAAAGATDRIPLLPAHIRDKDDARPADPVGPIASPLAVAPRRWHKLDFDYALYNSASVSQQPPVIEPDAIIKLTRLSERAAERKILLPNLVPRVFVRPPMVMGMIEVDMDCDTLLLDTDAETITLLFRGDIFVEGVETQRRYRVVVSLERADDERDMDDIVRELPRGVFHYAIEADDVKPDAPPVPSTSSELIMERNETLGYPLAPLPSVSLAEYAAISAELAEKRERRPEVLRKHGMEPDMWTLEERAWTEILAQRGSADGGALTKEAGRLKLEAQDRLATPAEAERTLADYARVAALVEKLGTTRGLAEASMSVPEWMRMGRRFRAIVGRDKAKKAELNDLLEAERGEAALALPQGERG